MRPRKSSAPPRNSKSRDKSSSSVQKSADKSSAVPTYGEVFPNGATIELIQPSAKGGLELQLTHGNKVTTAPKVEFGGRWYRPAKLNRSIQQIVRFPAKSVDFGSTTNLFAEIHKFFVSNGFSEEVSLVATHFSFAAWFADVLPLAPCLLITGSRLEADLLLDLLDYVVRRPLPMSEFNRRALTLLPMRLRPTLLIHMEQLGRASFDLLRKSNRPRAFVACKNELVDLFCAKAVYCGHIADCDVIDEGILHIGLRPASGRLPILDRKLCDAVAREFQSKLLAYRCRYILDVQQSQFDLSEFPSGIRILARVFGAPIVAAAALQKGLIVLLQEQDEERQALQWTDLRFVVLEAVLHHFHKQPGTRVHVGEITKTVNGILKGRGDATEREAREIGTILRDFGLRPKRNGGGFAILLDSNVGNRIHRIPFGMDVLTTHKGNEKCSYCHEILRGSKNGHTSGGEEKHK